MSETVQIVLIVALVVVVMLVLFRRQLSQFFIKANKDGLEASLTTHQPATGSGAGGTAAKASQASVQISGVRQLGAENTMSVGRSGVEISAIDQVGKGNELEVKPDPASKEHN
jgi:hypothetical protein